MLWSEMKSARPSEAHDRHQRIYLGSANTVGMPRNAVTASLVVVAEQAGEGPVVVRRELVANVVDHRGNRLVREGRGSGATRLIVPSAVHQPSAARPLHHAVEFTEKGIGAKNELLDVVDPTARIQIASLGSPSAGNLGTLGAEQGQREVFHPSECSTNTRSIPVNR